MVTAWAAPHVSKASAVLIVIWIENCMRDSAKGLQAAMLSWTLFRMKDDTLSRAHRITDVRAAAAFSEPLRRRLVLELAGRERALAELAASTGLDLKRVHYHVTALQKLGLVRVTRKQARAGRAIKFYRTVAD